MKEDRKQITLRIPDEEYEALKKLSERLSLPIQDLIIIALLKSFNRL